MMERILDGGPLDVHFEPTQGVAFAINALPEAPRKEHAEVILSGGGLVLKRGNGDTLSFGKVSETAYQWISGQERVCVGEVYGDQLLWAYFAKVRLQ